MCHSCRDAAALDVVDQTKMDNYSREIERLLKNDVYIVIFQSENNENSKTSWKNIFSHASAESVMKSFSPNIEGIASSIISTEDAIRQLNIGLRVDDLLSYRLTCHSSRIYTQILDPPNGVLRLVVINKVSDNQTLNEDPSIDTRMKQICKNIQRALSAPSSNNHNA
ncbi:hypothetical protein TRFO_28369 [Tritrichomonas foetus]|uniref:Uncharacterized protein n=1 Tax=Tritrichomonas foetus TaxID=1144522 RepID=A0A1J4K3Y2_9EUKA|nr:hypothetical protein TRFO_28369 [Tritrichomonas foetus]|eukprot:OHT04197.1 hypothetical protein TRFO_28369 [Tritrichomonas foetus]